MQRARSDLSVTVIQETIDRLERIGTCCEELLSICSRRDCLCRVLRSVPFVASKCCDTV